jgi:uncharacterized protein (TIGR03382 family)
MKKAVCVLGVVGLAAGGAFGQNISTDLVVDLSFDKSSVSIGETFNAIITASWNGVAGSYFSSFNVDLIASGNYAQVNSVDTIAWNNPALGFTGQPASIDGASIIGLQAAQFSLIPPFVTDNPILVTTINMTYTASGILSYSVQAAAGAPFMFSVTGPIFSDPVVEFGAEAFQSGSIGIPAPGAAGLLAAAGVLGVRRRR